MWYRSDNMEYTKVEWLEKTEDPVADGIPALNVSNLNRMEAGISEAVSRPKIHLGSIKSEDIDTEVDLGGTPLYLVLTNRITGDAVSVFPYTENSFVSFTDNGFKIKNFTNVTTSNIEKFFFKNDSAYSFQFKDVDGKLNCFVSNNAGKHSSTAKTVLIARYDMSVTFDYYYDSESSDKSYIYVGNKTVVNGEGGTSATGLSFTGTVAAGNEIEFRYVKDSSVNKNGDMLCFYNMRVKLTNANDWDYMAVTQKIVE